MGVVADYHKSFWTKFRFQGKRTTWRLGVAVARGMWLKFLTATTDICEFHLEPHMCQYNNGYQPVDMTLGNCS